MGLVNFATFTPPADANNETLYIVSEENAIYKGSSLVGCGHPVDLNKNGLATPVMLEDIENIRTIEIPAIDAKIQSVKTDLQELQQLDELHETKFNALEDKIEALEEELRDIKTRILPLEEFTQSFNTDDLVLSNSLRIGKAILTYDDTEKALVVSFIE